MKPWLFEFLQLACQVSGLMILSTVASTQAFCKTKEKRNIGNDNGIEYEIGRICKLYEANK